MSELRRNRNRNRNRNRRLLGRPRLRGAAASLATLLIATACGAGGQLEVTDAWGRASPMVADAAAFYVTIDNDSETDEQLVGATSDRCGAIEIHNSEMNDGVMSMGQADSELLALPSGGTLEMAPAGLHVMCLQVTEAPQLGEEISVTLEFESGATLNATVSIEDR